MPTNLRDPKSGQTYFQAMTQLATLLDLQGVKIADLPKIPFFENMWSKAAGNGLTRDAGLGERLQEQQQSRRFQQYAEQCR